MITSRQHDNWLKYKVDKIIKIKHQELFEPAWKKTFSRCLNYTLHRERWWLILLIILSLYILSIVLDCLNILSIKPDTAKAIIDQRTANIAAIISMTLAVVGFLISNLAVKESFAYGLLFKNSKLYPIIYFTLITIASLIIISTLRDTIKSEHIYARLVITGTYLVLCVLILIGYLFRTIIHFTNSKRIHQLLHAELIIEAKMNIKKGLIEKYSKKEYNKFMEMIGLKKYDWAEAWEPTHLNFDIKEVEETEITESKKKEYIVRDINLVDISVLIHPKKTAEKIYYSELGINSVITELDNFVWEKGKINSLKEKKALRKCLVLNKATEKEKQSNEHVRKYFDLKLGELVDESKHKSVTDILESYIELYEIQMKHQL